VTMGLLVNRLSHGSFDSENMVWSDVGIGRGVRSGSQ
jgi:hypothetical protein